METLLIILSFMLLFVLSLNYLKNKQNKELLDKKEEIRDLKKMYNTCIEKLIKKEEYCINLKDKNDILTQENIRLENKIDLDAMSFDDIINKENNDTLISNFILELHFNLFNIDKYIETTKDKRSKEYKEVIKQKKLLLTYIESVSKFFEEDKFDIELLNNYKSLSYKDLIVFDEDINYTFTLVDTGDTGKLVCTINTFCVPDEIDNTNKITDINFISKKQKEFLKSKGLVNDAKIMSEVGL